MNEGTWDQKTQATQLSIAPYRTAHFTTLAICRILAFNGDIALYHNHYPPDFFHSQLSSLLYLLVVFGGELLVLFLLVLPVDNARASRRWRRR